VISDFLRVVEGAMQGPMQSICTKIEDRLIKFEQKIDSHLVYSSKRHETSPSPNVYGSLLLEKIVRKIQIFIPTEGEPIFPDTSIFDFKNEGSFVSSCFNRLQELLVDNRLMSSEDFRWLPIAGSACHDQKPDLVVLHPAFYTRKQSKRTILCGVPASRVFFDEMKFIDFKLNDGNAAFGELIIHLNHLQDNIATKPRETIVTRGAVAGKDGIRLVECLLRTPVSVLSVKWTDKGGAKTFTDFFKSSCMELEHTKGFILDQVCKQLNVLILESQIQGGNEIPCFLGAGAMGKVFRVRNISGKQCALKIVLGETNARSLEREYMIVKKINSVTIPDTGQIIVNAEEYCKVIVEDTIVGAGYLMTPVGTPIDRKDPTHFHLGMKSLFALHQLSYYHGDARAANMLFWEDRVILCDLRETYPFIEDYLTVYHEDIATFLKSYGLDIDSEWRALLNLYDPRKSEDEALSSISEKATRLLFSK
jgi:hypothetical protein